MSLLDTVTIEKLLPPNQKIITIQSSETIPNALKTLALHNIYCAPVLEGNKIIGLLDLVDIVTFIVNIFTDEDLMATNFFSKLHMEQRWYSEHTGEILNLSHKNPLVTVKMSDSLKLAVQFLHTKKCRRLLVENNEGKIAGILTQSAIIEWLNSNLSSLNEVGEKSIEGLGSEKLFSVYYNQPVIDAFKLMSENRITSIAVLESNGKIFSNVSAKDLKVVVNNHDMFSNLFKSTQQFISLSRQLIYETEFAAAIVCHENDNVEHVIKKLFVSKIHRIYVVDSYFRPVRVISLTDILALVDSK